MDWESSLNVSNVLLQPTYHHVFEGDFPLHLDTASEPMGIKRFQQCRETIGMAVVGYAVRIAAGLGVARLPVSRKQVRAYIVDDQLDVGVHGPASMGRRPWAGVHDQASRGDSQTCFFLTGCPCPGGFTAGFGVSTGGRFPPFVSGSPLGFDVIRLHLQCWFAHYSRCRGRRRRVFWGPN